MTALTLSDRNRFRGPALALDGCRTLDELAEHRDLEVLSLEHFPAVRSLEPLRILRKLRYLSLTSQVGWDGTNRHLLVDSFEPLTSLKKLEVIQMLGVVPKRGRLEPLARIPSLRKVSIGNTNFYQLEDFARLAAEAPRLQASLRPVRQMNFVSECRRCRRFPLLFLDGTKPRLPRYVCPACNRKQILAHLARWNAAGGRPRFEGYDDRSPEELLAEFGNPNAR
ncbi:MAG TPA: hypothetical protein VEB66_07615 [Opitutaceae bacterium]|nr:hypothetical protein [Opitutaceae bacterium]